MCWSGEASAALAAVGFAGTVHVAYKGEDRALWLPLFYFSLMELLQAFTYTVIDQCGNTLNQILTLLGYLHISFQPFFVNLVSMYFIPKDIRQRISRKVYGLCCLGSAIFLSWLYPLESAGVCPPYTTLLCGPGLCSVHGNWHIAWEVPLNGYWWLMFAYTATAFVLPVLYGSWKMTLYHLITGPTLAFLSTNNKNEWPAVWCLLSIGLLLVVAKTPLREKLHVKHWPLWRVINP